MSIKDITPDDIDSMRERLAARQAQRRFEDEAAQAINMVHRRQPLIIEERDSPLEPRRKPQRPETVPVNTPVQKAISASAVAFLLARAFSDNWLFLLVFGFSVFAAAIV